MTAHCITFARDTRGYHSWTCSCGTEGELAFLRSTARLEADEHIQRPGTCRSCGSSIKEGRTVCGALECGGEPLP